MSKITFSTKTMEISSKSLSVLCVSNKAIIYSNEFKIHFPQEYFNGSFPCITFQEASFAIDKLIKKHKFLILLEVFIHSDMQVLYSKDHLKIQVKSISWNYWDNAP